MTGWSLKKRVRDIAPDEIFLDASNLPGHESARLEGRVVPALSRCAALAVGAAFTLVALIFVGRAFSLEILNGNTYAEISRENTLEHTLLFAARGVISDRKGTELAWNEAKLATTTQGAASTTEMFALRKYIEAPGFSHVLGFISYPKSDKTGNWWREEYTGLSGVELSYDSVLSGKNGSIIVEEDARGKVQRQNIIAPPEDGTDLRLSIDAAVQEKLYTQLSEHARTQGFKGGAGVIMDVRTGEILALVSFPQYDNNAFTSGDSASVQADSNDPSTPLLNRAVAGVYTPGSIVKPIFAAAALAEGIISPEKTIVSTGQLVLPNPYDPSNPSIFRDWAVHGAVDMRTALAVSSDEYFYTIGGGFGGQKGLGIAKIDEYSRRFGLAQKTGIVLKGEQEGVIPTPEWKEKVFPGDPWRIGNTYHTSIGQYGFQVTPIQAVRFTAAIANGGKLPKPHLVASSTPEFVETGMNDAYLKIAREGMRMAVTSSRTDATVKSLNIPGIEIAAKTGTAQLGTRNQFMNSWSVGFWPASDPHYAYAVVLEKAPAGTASGAAPAMQPFFYWLVGNHPEYLD